MLNLCECKIGKKYVIHGIKQGCSIKIIRRLCDLGFVNGTSITVSRKSALKKVLLIEIRGFLLSLQSNVARWIDLYE